MSFSRSAAIQQRYLKIQGQDFSGCLDVLSLTHPVKLRLLITCLIGLNFPLENFPLELRLLLLIAHSSRTYSTWACRWHQEAPERGLTFLGPAFSDTLIRVRRNMTDLQYLPVGNIGLSYGVRKRDWLSYVVRW